MNDDLNIPLPQGEPLDETTIQKIAAQLKAASTKPVSPLPSNATLLAISLTIFVIVSFVIAALVKFKAFQSLSGPEMAAYYGSVAVFAALFGRAVTERMIPGERRLVPSLALWITALAFLGLLMSLIFSNYGTSNFVASGIPCLRLGSISALISGVLGWRLLRRGYFVSPRETILLFSFFAGLVGVAVLALHCPIRNSLHFLVWHLGAMVLAGIAGWFLGGYIENAD